MSLLRKKPVTNLSDGESLGVENLSLSDDAAVAQQAEPTTNSIVANKHEGDHRMKVLLDTNFTGEQLKKGVTVQLSDYMDGGDSTNVIVNGVGTTAIGSNVPASVTTSMNLFNLREGGANGHPPRSATCHETAHDALLHHLPLEPLFAAVGRLAVDRSLRRPEL